MCDCVTQVARFEGSISILPTKTRPNKLSMIVDNGTKYTYLFKVNTAVEYSTVSVSLAFIIRTVQYTYLFRM